MVSQASSFKQIKDNSHKAIQCLHKWMEMSELCTIRQKEHAYLKSFGG